MNCWTVKSSSILSGSEADAVTSFDRYYDENERLLGEDGERFSAAEQGSAASSPTKPAGRYSTSHSPTNGRLVITEEGIYRQELWSPNNDDPSARSTTKVCQECRKTTPRRSHHCPLCGICVLRKDHHCFLTGGCVGLANQVSVVVQNLPENQKLH